MGTSDTEGEETGGGRAVTGRGRTGGGKVAEPEEEVAEEDI